MGRSRRNHEQTTKGIITYMKEHLHKDITLESVAKQTCFSVPWVQKFFKKETGENLFSYLLKLRIDKSKNLLLATDLTITEIGYEVGFNSYTRFAIAFKEQEGMSPTAFRRTAKLRGEAPVLVPFQPGNSPSAGRERFRDLFAGEKLLPCWKEYAGEWRTQNGELIGMSEEDITIRYTDPLPENFRVEFEFCFLVAPHLRLYLYNGTFSELYLSALIGKHLNGVAEFLFPNLDRFWSHDAQIIPGAWHKFRLEIIDDTVKVSLDETELLLAKDPFPPDFSARSHLQIGGWQAHFKIRNFAVFDCGFLPMVPAARQADTLYKSGMYDRALLTYMRLLEGAAEPAGIAELQYKIGMCYLHQQAFVQSRAWLSKVLPASENDFWFRSAQHSLLELCRQERDYPAFLKNASTMFGDPKHRNAVRSCIDRARLELMAEGFFDRALGCVQTLHELEEAGSHFAKFVENNFYDLLFSLRRYNEASTYLERIIKDQNTPGPVALMALNNLADGLSHAGNFEASEKVLTQFRHRTIQQHELVRCDLIHGMNLRGQRCFENAAAFLSRSLERYPGATYIGVFAVLTGANIYSQIGNLPEARELRRDMERRFPESYCIRGHHRSTFFYPPLLLEGKLDLAAEMLLSEAKSGGAAPWVADRMVRAGILFELQNVRDRAVSVWSEVTRRFRPDRCCFYGDLARSLIDEKQDILETMPYPAINRAEMFYLAGLLFRKRGEERESQKYFQLAVKDDPTLNWFTWLAKQEIAGSKS